jgi:hypothetical protein
MIDLEATPDYCSEPGGSGDIEQMIVEGAPGICLINEDPSGLDPCPDNNGPWYDCVAIQTGNPQNVLDGVNTRLETDGGCDINGNGIDDFFETIEMVFDSGNPFTSTYEPRDCDPVADGLQMSPRLVTIIVLEEDPDDFPSSVDFPIVAFAAFYLAGCAHESVVVVDESDLDPDCESPGAADYRDVTDLYVAATAMDAVEVSRANALCHQGTVHGGPQPRPTCTPAPTPSPTPSPTPTPGPGTPTPAPTPSPTPGPGGGNDCGSPGHCVVYGRFVKLIVSGGEVGGDPSDQTTLFGISLVE